MDTDEEIALGFGSSGLEPTPIDDSKCFHSIIRRLPLQPVKDLLTSGVCERCTLRIFCPHESICSYGFLSTPDLRDALYELTEKADDLVEKEYVKELEEFKVCNVCLGILQFAYQGDERGKSIKKNCVSDFAALLGAYVKQEGYQLDSFSLEVSLPQHVVEKEKEIQLFLKNKYSSEPWFVNKLTHEGLSVKEFLKKSLTTLLEQLLGVRSSNSCFKVRLTYTHSDTETQKQQTTGNNRCFKRKKIGDDVILRKRAGVTESNKCESPKDSSALSENDGMVTQRVRLDDIHECCSLTFSCIRTPIYVGGRYLKYSRNVSQTRWIIDDERMGEASVEEIVGGSILPIFYADSYKFHAAGREDIDVRMLGTGRPFLVEIQNARKIPSYPLLKEIELKINCLENKLVRVRNLDILDNQGWELMREGEAEKQKQYCALVWISRPLNNNDEQKLSSLKEMQILQKTPIRVLHRRSPLDREKTIHWMRIETIDKSSHYFLLHLCTQAGTYIKEFVHGDLGRTHPSLGSILECRAEILQLDVTDVKMNCFQG